MFRCLQIRIKMSRCKVRRTKKSNLVKIRKGVFTSWRTSSKNVLKSLTNAADKKKENYSLKLFLSALMQISNRSLELIQKELSMMKFFILSLTSMMRSTRRNLLQLLLEINFS